MFVRVDSWIVQTIELATSTAPSSTKLPQDVPEIAKLSENGRFGEITRLDYLNFLLPDLTTITLFNRWLHCRCDAIQKSQSLLLSNLYY